MMLKMHYPTYFARFVDGNPWIAQLPVEEQLKQFRAKGLLRNSNFFGGIGSLQAFQEVVIPQLEGDIDLACVGCATGKEPFSILLMNWDIRDRLHIDAYDSDPDAIAMAGQYELLPGHVKEIAEKSMAAPGEAYKVVKDEATGRMRLVFHDGLRERVNFGVHDIIESPLPRKYGALFLRKVLGHYPPKGRERIVANVSESLHQNGWLVCESRDATRYNLDQCPYGKWLADLNILGFQRQNITPNVQDFLIHHIYRKA
jgi:chemotaxis methyl-accepting protein methylase